MAKAKGKNKVGTTEVTSIFGHPMTPKDKSFYVKIFASKKK